MATLNDASSATGNRMAEYMAADSSSALEKFDLVILGCGTASKLAAWDFAGQGQRVAVVERRYVGGACTNIACLPSKNVIYTAQVASYARRLNEFGMSGSHLDVEMVGIRDRKRAMVNREVELNLDMFKKSGAQLIFGDGRFIGPKTIEVVLPEGGTRRLQGKRVVIGTGSRAQVGSITGLQEAMPLTHVEALELDVVPDHLVILGGGYVGLEFAQAMRRLGSQVTLIEHNTRLLHREDEDVSAAVECLLLDEGVVVVLNAKVLQIAGASGRQVTLLVEKDGVQEKVEATHILVAAGRIPNTDGLGAELAGVALTKNGYVQVNEKLETSASGIWAVGDVAGSPQFTHVSEDDYRVFRAGVMGEHRTTAVRVIPFCLYLEPEVARVGMSETEAQRQDIPYRLYKVPMTTVLRARAIVETRGFMKALISTEDDSILGFIAFCAGAGEVMSAVQLAMIAKLPYTAIRDAIFAHPTMVEGLHSLFTFGLQKQSTVKA